MMLILRPTTVKSAGFALFSVVWIVAIVSVLSIAMVSSYVSNTRATLLEVERVQAQHLLDAALRFAVLSLASPRTSVAGGAIPTRRLAYRNDVKQISIEINNESAFVDLLSADTQLLKSLLIGNGVAYADVANVLTQLTALANSGRKPGYRLLRETLRQTPGRDEGSGDALYQALIQHASLHNGQAGIHPELASAQVLSLLSDLPKAKRDLLLQARGKKTPSLFSTPIESRFFSPKISPHYRIFLRMQLNGRDYTRVHIIKMLNQPGDLFELVATL